MFESTLGRPRCYYLEKISGSMLIRPGHNYLVVSYPQPILNGESEVSIVRRIFFGDSRVSFGDLDDPFGRLGISASEEVIEEVVAKLQEGGFKENTSS